MQDYIGGAFATDGIFLYLGTVTSQEILKIDPVTMATVGNTAIGFSSEDIRTDGAFLYVRTVSIPTRVIKIDIPTMGIVGTWVCPDGANSYRALILEAGFCYVTRHNFPSVMYQIDTATMLTGLIWNAPAGKGWNPRVCSDGTYIYCALTRAPGEFYQINPATMLTVNSFVPPIAAGASQRVLNIGTGFVYLLWGGTLYKVNTTNMTSPANLVVGADFFSIVTDINYLYISAYSPAIILKINPQTMVVAGTWTGNGTTEDDLNTDPVVYGSRLVAGFRTNPAGVSEILTPTMVTDSFAAGLAGCRWVDDLVHQGQSYFAAIDMLPTFNTTVLRFGSTSVVTGGFRLRGKMS